MKRILAQGKTEKKSIKIERYINYSVLIGFILMLFWIGFLYPKVFIDIKLVLSILFIPGLIMSSFLSKKIINALGYKTHIKNKHNYNFLIKILTYLLITIPIGNFLIVFFLGLNTIFKENDIQTIYLTPDGIIENYKGVKTAEVVFDETNKRLKFGKVSTEKLKTKKLKVDLSKGLWGYYVIVERKLI